MYLNHCSFSLRVPFRHSNPYSQMLTYVQFLKYRRICCDVIHWFVKPLFEGSTLASRLSPFHFCVPSSNENKIRRWSAKLAKYIYKTANQY